MSPDFEKQEGGEVRLRLAEDQRFRFGRFRENIFFDGQEYALASVAEGKGHYVIKSPQTSEEAAKHMNVDEEGYVVERWD